MVGHGGSSAGSYLADPTSPIPSHCASIVVTSTVRVNAWLIACDTQWLGWLGQGMNKAGGTFFHEKTLLLKFHFKGAL